SNRARMSPRCPTGTPTRPTSPRARAWSASYPVWVGRSNATDRPVWALSPLARFRRNSALDSRADECPAYVRISQGWSRDAGAWGPGPFGLIPLLIPEPVDLGQVRLAQQVVAHPEPFG